MLFSTRHTGALREAARVHVPWVQSMQHCGDEERQCTHAHARHEATRLTWRAARRPAPSSPASSAVGRRRGRTCAAVASCSPLPRALARRADPKRPVIFRTQGSGHEARRTRGTIACSGSGQVCWWRRRLRGGERAGWARIQHAGLLKGELDAVLRARLRYEGSALSLPAEHTHRNGAGFR